MSQLEREEHEAEGGPEVRGVEEVVAAEADQVPRREGHGSRPGDTRPDTSHEHPADEKTSDRRSARAAALGFLRPARRCSPSGTLFVVVIALETRFTAFWRKSLRHAGEPKPCV